MSREKISSTDKIHDALDLLREASQEKRVELQHLLKNLHRGVKHAQQDVTKKAKHAVGALDDHAHDKPWHYISGAALSGFLLGLIFRSRR